MRHSPAAHRMSPAKMPQKPLRQVRARRALEEALVSVAAQLPRVKFR
jgi:hypothetical protein